MPVIGHKKITSFFTKAIANDHLAHAYLFSGPKDVGKKAVAKWLVAQLFQAKDEEFWSKPHPDISWVKRAEDKKNITIEQLRELRGRMLQSPLLARRKVAIVEEAQQMTREAANAFLKTLEEPSGEALLIMTSSESVRLLATIKSRCVQIQFSKLATPELQAALEKQGVKKAGEMARLSRGLPERAWRWAQEPSELEPKREQIKDLLKLLQAGIAHRLSYIDKIIDKNLTLAEQNSRLSGLLASWQEVVRDITLAALSLSANIVNSWTLKDIEKLAQTMSLGQATQLQQSLAAAGRQIDGNVNPRLILGNILLNF